jgi:hypothetical protein
MIGFSPDSTAWCHRSRKAFVTDGNSVLAAVTGHHRVLDR